MTSNRYPLRAIAATVGRGVAVVVGVIGTLTTFGVLTVAQRDALTAAGAALDLVLGAVVGLVAAAGAVASAFRTATTGEPVVTPVADPRNDAGTPLVPAEGRGSVFDAGPDVSLPHASER